MTPIRRSSFAMREWLVARIALWERVLAAPGDRTTFQIEKANLFLLAHRSALAYLDGAPDEPIDLDKFITQVSRRK
jgi:hypothetical protein